MVVKHARNAWGGRPFDVSEAFTAARLVNYIWWILLGARRSSMIAMAWERLSDFPGICRLPRQGRLVSGWMRQEVMLL